MTKEQALTEQMAKNYLLKAIMLSFNNKITLVSACESIIEDVKKVPLSASEQCELNNYIESIQDPTYIIYSLYFRDTLCCLFETMDIPNNLSMPKFNELFKETMFVRDEHNGYDKITPRYLLRRMRNSFSHFKYSFDGKNWNIKDDENGDKQFEVKFSTDELLELVEKLSDYIVQNCNPKL